jgi:golgi phosphoprotein 3
MLTIPEEFLLLTLRDEEGGFVDILPQASAAGFVGAAIMELALQSRVDSDLEKIWVVDKTPIGEACVDIVLAKIAAPGFDSATDRLIDQLVDTGPEVRELALKRLVDRKILTVSEGTILWFLKTRRYPVIDGRELREAKLRILAILLGGELPGPRDVCLMSLAHSCGILGQVVPPSELKRAEERVSQFAKMDLIGQNVARSIAIFTEIVARASFPTIM